MYSDAADCYREGSLPAGPAQPYKQLDPSVFETQMDALCDILNAADLSTATTLSGLDKLCDMFNKLHIT